ncbi:MAG: AraC family transcriptional regulator [Lachnospiraceae bacterium]
MNPETDSFSNDLENYPYEEFKVYDNSPISVESWSGTDSVPIHCHDYYEIVIVKRGFFLHTYKDVQVPLVPGDVMIIEPHYPHGFGIQTPANIINCMFYIEELHPDSQQILKDLVAPGTQLLHSLPLITKTAILLKDPLQRDFSIEVSAQTNIVKQGIVHFNSAQMNTLETLLQHMLDEQEHPSSTSIYAKASYLQLLLVNITRTKKLRPTTVQNNEHGKSSIILDALIYIEEHLDEKIDFAELAVKSYVSLAYFRTVFKDVTGITPVDYLNRLKIIKSLEYLSNPKITIADAAAMVGFYDANYYSRIFKKVMGYSPRNYKGV